MLQFHFLDQIDIGGPCREIGVGFDGREQIGLPHHTPTLTSKKSIGAGASRFCKLKVKSPQAAPAHAANINRLL
jgi:hypothetical protein